METQTLVVKGSEWSHGMEDGVLFDGEMFCVLGLLGRSRGIKPDLMLGCSGFELITENQGYLLSKQEKELNRVAMGDPILSKLVNIKYPILATTLAQTITSINDCEFALFDDADKIIEDLRPEFAKLGVGLDYRPNE